MCGRYVVQARIEAIERRFRIRIQNRGDAALLEAWERFLPNYNVGATDFAPVITSDKPNQIQFFSFGYSPGWSDTRKCILNARSEGKDNPSNDMNYHGGPGIIKTRMWREAVEKRRCVVFADAFYEGPEKEKLAKPYLVYLRDRQRPLAFAGLWSYWTDQKTGEQIGTFAILTHVSNTVTAEIGHQRSPVILDPGQLKLWLDTNRPLAEATELLKPYPGKLMNAYPVSDTMRSGRIKDISVTQPTGKRLFPEHEHEIKSSSRFEGMGTSPARKRRQEEQDKKQQRLPFEDEDLTIQ